MRCGVLAFVWLWAALPSSTAPLVGRPSAEKTVYVIPVRDDITTPMVYLIRRGVKEAMSAQADLIILDMDTYGGAVSSTIEILQILNEFPGQTVTFVNTKAISAGAFISIATQKIYMAPQSVIGAAAVVTASPMGGGTEDLPKTVEVKTTSALSAMVRAQAEKNGHNPEIIQAMIDKTKELKIEEDLLNKEGNILTLTDKQAGKLYGTPPKPLLSLGTVENLDAVRDVLGYGDARVTVIEPTGAEKVGAWLTAISPLLLIVGVIGLYIEFKTPGFGLPGIVGIAAFALYFLGGYTAGLSGLGWVLIFLLGLALVAVELFLLPGSVFIGLGGATLMLAAIIMALVDLYPHPGPGPGWPQVPAFETFTFPLRTLLIATAGSIVAALVLSRFLPRTSLYRTIVSQSASGVLSDARLLDTEKARLGQVGTTIAALRPSGKAQFGEELLDVVSQGDFVPAQTRVRIIAFQNSTPVVDVENNADA